MNLANQDLPAMIDTGSNPNCVSLRCVLGSNHLKNLERHGYSGRQIVDANGQPMQPSFMIKCDLCFGSPEVIIPTAFVVIKSLPFSCILGQKTLQTFFSWEVSNENKIVTFNNKHVVPFYNNGSAMQTVQLITIHKTTIAPFMSTVIDVKACGPGLGTFRPTSHINVLTEGNTTICNRLSIEIVPSVNILTHQNCSRKLEIYNFSATPKTIAKGVTIAQCSSGYDEYFLDNNDNVNLITNLNPVDLICNNITDLLPSELVQARSLLNEFQDVFSVSNKIIGRTNIMQFDVDTHIDPVTVPLRRVPLHHRDIVQQLISKYEQLHLIQPIDSPFRASTVLVKKKNIANGTDVSDQYRLCTDYRALNNHICSSGWPSPSLDECLDAIADSNMFSSIDFNNGYHQIPCSDHAKRVLAFSPGYGFKQFTWSVMPQGIKTASSCFQHAMMKTFQNRENCILPPFYDDIIIKGSGFTDHLQNVRTILCDVRKAKFTLNALKCSFFQKNINYLGHLISEHIIHIDPNRIKAIIHLSAPSDVKTLRSFIGMVQFCHRFIHNLNVILAPLYDLLKDKQPFVWSTDCQVAFDDLKSILSSPPVLYTPSKKDKFVFESDASDIGLGGCLKATNEAGEFVVGYCSKKFVNSELNWHIVEKETFAIMYGVRYFHHYLVGQQFTVRCDNRIVCYLKDKARPRNKKMLNWALELSEYDYCVQHIPSKNNNISDCLSRLLCITPILFADKVSVQDFITEQQSDSDCCAAKSYLSQNRRNYDVNLLGSLKSFRKHLHISGDILMWKNKYVVPKGLRHAILRLCHDHPMSGHFGSDRTYQRFHHEYFWPKALADVDNFVKSCEKCNGFNPPRTAYVKAPLQPIPTTRRFELVCYDIAGPFLPVTLRGNRYALILVDHYTHWPEFVALPDIKASTIATALIDQWCCRYGIPERFHSDGASNVHGAVILELCKRLGVFKSKSSRLHPQGDGMSESFVKQLKSCIQKQVESNGTDWDLYLHTTAFAIRSNVAYNTKFSPSELMIGSKLVQPIDNIMSTTPKSFSEKQSHEFARDLTAKITDSNRLVNDNLIHSRMNMKSQYDMETKQPFLSVGDTVMLWKPYKKIGISRCFQPNWDGPWVIESFSSDTYCRIVRKDSSETINNVHVNQLKSTTSRDNNLPYINTQLDDTVIDTSDIHDHYLEDFEDDDDNVVQNYRQPNLIDNRLVNDVNGGNVIQNEQPNVIDNTWVNLDVNNILPNRTRGIIQNYNDLVAGNG